MPTKSRTIPVSIRPWLYEGRDGYRVRWHDGTKQRCYFVLSMSAAKDTKSRAKIGKLPRYWAVKA